jgi:hypothetical protein
MMYDSRKPLVSCEYEHLGRQVGIFVDEPYDHKGLDTKCVEVYCEEVTVNTRAVGSTERAPDWKWSAVSFTMRLIRKLDRLIAELQGHRKRLAREFEKLEVGDVE